MAKVEFDPGIESVRGILMGTDPYYIRRYPDRDGGVMHIVQARPDRSGHTPSAAEKLARVVFVGVSAKFQQKGIFIKAGNKSSLLFAQSKNSLYLCSVI